MKDHRYDGKFYSYTRGVTLHSAHQIIKIVQKLLPIQSVLDVGCASGVWLKAWAEHGIKDYLGIDLESAAVHSSDIAAGHFQSCDLSRPFHLGRRFDLVVSLEVAEHLPLNRAESFVSDLTAHGPAVLFSAAPPGQGGENHVNEQRFEFWRDLFARHRYQLFDCVRPAIRSMTTIAPWYRYNLFLYVHESTVALLSPDVHSREVKSDRSIPDVSPWSYKLRKFIVRQLPSRVIEKLVRYRTQRLSL